VDDGGRGSGRGSDDPLRRYGARPRFARWRRPLGPARDTTGRGSATGSGAHRPGRLARPRQWPAQRRRRLPRQAVCVRRAASPLGSAVAAPRPVARTLASNCERRVRHREPPGVHRRQTASPIGSRDGGARTPDASQGSRCLEENGLRSRFRAIRRCRLECGRGLHPSPAPTIVRAWRQGANPDDSGCWIPHIRGKGGMISFKSIFSRIIFLHVIALVITAIVMPVVLYWFFKWSANDLHDQAMREQADSVAHYLVLRPDSSWTLDLPPALRDIYSQAGGRYGSAVLDDTGCVLFSSLKDRSSIFSADPRSSDVAYLETRRSNASVSGVSLLKEMDGRRVWVQVGEDLAHRDVIIDDIVADFFKRVGWITLPMLLFLLAIDIVIFRRALRPLLNASEMAKKINPKRTDVRLPPKEIPKEFFPRVQGVTQAFDRLGAGSRVQREFPADAAHELRTPLTILRSRVDTLADRGISKALHQDIE